MNEKQLCNVLLEIARVKKAIHFEPCAFEREDLRNYVKSLIAELQE